MRAVKKWIGVKQYLIEYIIVGKKKTRVVRIGGKGLRKLIQKEINEGVKVADILDPE